jgi:hypothetical protein
MRSLHQESGDAGTTFLGLIMSALASRKAYLGSTKDGQVPHGFEEQSGWYEEEKYQGSDIGLMPVWVHGPNASLIGWIDGKRVYLDPYTSHKAASDMLASQGQTLPPQVSVNRMLDAAHKLVEKDAQRGRLTVRKTVAKKQQSVLAINASEIFGDLEAEQAAASQAEDVETEV